MYDKLCPRDLFPDGHPWVAVELERYSEVLVALDKPAEALAALEGSLTIRRALVLRTARLSSEAEALDELQTLLRIRGRFLSLISKLPQEQATRFYAPLWESKALVTRVVQQRHQATRVLASKDAKVRKTWQELQNVRQQIEWLQHDAGKEGRAEELRDGTTRKEKLERELAALMPEYQRLKELSDLRPADLANRLPVDAVFLDFTQYHVMDKLKKVGRRYVVFVITPREAVQMIDLGDAGPINEAVGAWRMPSPGTSRAPPLGFCRNGSGKRSPSGSPPEPRRSTTLPTATWSGFPLPLCPARGPAPFCSRTTSCAGAARGFPARTAPLSAGRAQRAALPACPRRGAIRSARQQGEQTVAIPQRHRARNPPVQGARPETAGCHLERPGGKHQRLFQELPKARYAHLATHGFFDEKARAAEHCARKKALNEWDLNRDSKKRSIGLGDAQSPDLHGPGVDRRQRQCEGQDRNRRWHRHGRNAGGFANGTIASGGAIGLRNRARRLDRRRRRRRALFRRPIAPPDAIVPLANPPVLPPRACHPDPPSVCKKAKQK